MAYVIIRSRTFGREKRGDLVVDHRGDTLRFERRRTAQVYVSERLAAEAATTYRVASESWLPDYIARQLATEAT